MAEEDSRANLMGLFSPPTVGTLKKAGYDTAKAQLKRADFSKKLSDLQESLQEAAAGEGEVEGSAGVHGEGGVEEAEDEEEGDEQWAEHMEPEREGETVEQRLARLRRNRKLRKELRRQGEGKKKKKGKKKAKARGSSPGTPAKAPVDVPPPPPPRSSRRPSKRSTAASSKAKSSDSSSSNSTPRSAAPREPVSPRRPVSPRQPTSPRGPVSPRRTPSSKMMLPQALPRPPHRFHIPFAPDTHLLSRRLEGSGPTMRAFDNLDVVYDEDLTPVKAICHICLCFLSFPVELPCGHVYCLSCLEVQTKKRNKCMRCKRVIPPDSLEVSSEFEDFLAEVDVRCYWRAQGCPWAGKRKQLPQHAASCWARPWSCVDCGVTGFSQQEADAHIEECPSCSLCEACGCYHGEDEGDHCPAQSTQALFKYTQAYLMELQRRTFEALHSLGGRARRGSRLDGMTVQVSRCSRCRKAFKVESNEESSCQYHEGTWSVSGRAWSCCQGLSRLAPGCCSSAHIPDL